MIQNSLAQAHKPKILLVGSEGSLPGNLEQTLKDQFPLERAFTPNHSLEIVRRHEPFLVLIDLMSKNLQDLDLIHQIKNHSHHAQIIGLTQEKDFDEAIRVIQAGAIDYLDSEKDQVKLLELLHRLSEDQNFESPKKPSGDVFLGKGPEMAEILKVINRIAPLPTTVLLQGESGTGKEVMARLIHQKSHLADQAFIPVSLPSIPANLVESVLFGHEKGAFTGAYRKHEGKFEQANGGTIFLDEVGDLHPDMQSKLLRVLQEGEFDRIGGTFPVKVNVRVISATKTNLKKAVKEGKFRDDLFYRLNVLPITLPPLRKRLEDLAELSDLFIKRYGKRFNKKVNCISSNAIGVLQRYRWPGNIRELENLMERMVAILSPDQDELKKGDIPIEYYYSHLSEQSLTPANLDRAVVNYERNLIVRALRQHNWSRKKTAQALGISYGILKYKVKKFGISIPRDYRPKLKTGPSK